MNYGLSGTLDQYISAALQSEGFLSMTKAGGGVLLLGLLVGLLMEWLKFYQGRQANWIEPVLRVLLVAALIGLYPFIIKLVTSFIASFGDLGESSQKASEIFKQRLLLFIDLIKKETDKGFLDSLSMNRLKLNLLGSVAEILSYITIGLIEALKFIQAMVLRILVFLGPVMLAAGAIPGPFRRFPANWFMLFFSVSFWSVVMSSMLSMLAATTSQILFASDIGYVQEIVESLTWIMVIFSVPMLSAALVYGGGFNSALGEVSNITTGGVTRVASLLKDKT